MSQNAWCFLVGWSSVRENILFSWYSLLLFYTSQKSLKETRREEKQQKKGLQVV